MGKLLIPNFKKGGRMLSRNKDTDYLALSARIHAMEGRLLTRDRMDRMIDAREESEALKVLTECGYGGAEGLRAQDVERVLATARAETFQELSTAAPDPRVVDVFRLKYDYHNAKVLVKAEAMGTDAGRLLLDGGRVPASGLAENYQKEQLGGLSLRFQSAIREARETLAASHDPQLADLALDRACYEEMAQLARDLDSRFLQRYVQLLVDVANLRTAVRVHRMGREPEFLRQVLLPGGSVSEQSIAAARGENLGDLFHTGGLAQGAMTDFERACDDAVTAYLASERRVPFGEEPVVGYLYAREAEFTAIRTIFAGRAAKLEGDVIRRRLRETYV